jgi:hypothetical protein
MTLRRVPSEQGCAPTHLTQAHVIERCAGIEVGKKLVLVCVWEKGLPNDDGSSLLIQRPYQQGRRVVVHRREDRLVR